MVSGGGGDEGGCGFERDAGEGWEGDAEGTEDVGDGKGEVVVSVEGVGGEDGEEEEVLGDVVLVGLNVGGTAGWGCLGNVRGC